jgi:hypothetical protein
MYETKDAAHCFFCYLPFSISYVNDMIGYVLVRGNQGTRYHIILIIIQDLLTSARTNLTLI